MEFPDKRCPSYAMLSHRWCNDEPNFQDIANGTGKNKQGYGKLVYCAEQAARDGYDYFWIDTVCIDKSSSTELTRALNSMYSWYAKSSVCYVYMRDVGSKKEFSRSTWFSRGWTLQELIAPSEVIFFDCRWERLGRRDHSLLGRICKRTNIPPEAFGKNDLSEFSVDKRMSWIRGRETEEEEDLAYCLQGIFDVHLLPVYSEGRVKAFCRLRAAIAEQSSLIAKNANIGHTGKAGTLVPYFGSSCFEQKVPAARYQAQLHIKITRSETICRCRDKVKPWLERSSNETDASRNDSQMQHKSQDEARQEDPLLTAATVLNAGHNCFGTIRWQKASRNSSKEIASCNICHFKCRVWERGEPPQLSDGYIVPTVVVWNRFHRASKPESGGPNLLSESLPMFTCFICKDGRELFYPELRKHLSGSHVIAELPGME